MTKALRDRVLKRHSLIRLAAFLSVIVFLFITVVAVENMLLSVVLAFVLSYMLGPPISYFERRGVDRVLVTVLLFSAVGAALGLTIYITLPLMSEQVRNLQQDMPKYMNGLTKLMNSLKEKGESLEGDLFTLDFSQIIEGRLMPMTESFFARIPDFIKQLLTVMLLAPFLAFFMIKDGRQFSRNLLALVPNNIFELTYSIYNQINDQMGQFVRARLMESLIVGFVTWLGLIIIGFPFALLMAIFAAITNLIPYIGPIIGTIPAVVLALINGASTVELSLLLLVYFIAQIIDAAFIIPVVVAKIVDLHPITVIVVIIIGAQVMGVVGMLISIPVASALKVTLGTIFRHLTDYNRL